MNAMPNLDIICKKVVEAYQKIYGDKIRGIYLYGSYARGDFNEDSDVDFAAIVEGEQVELRRERSEHRDYLTDVELDYDVVISFGVIPAFYFDKYFSEVPYYINVVEEGKRLA